MPPIRSEIFDLPDEEGGREHVRRDEEDLSAVLAADVVADAAFGVGSAAGHEDDDPLPVFG